MSRSRPTMLSVTIGVLIVVLAAGPLLSTAQAQEQIELRVWDQFTGPESEFVDAIYAGFEETNPNIDIVREAVSTDQMRQTVNTAIASGTGPDIIGYDPGPGYAGVLVDAGLLSPLDDVASQSGWADRIPASSLEATSIDGTLYGLPLTVDLIGMYYNKTLLDQEGLTVPETVDDLIAFCGAAAEKGYTPITFGNNPGWEAFHQFSMTSNQMLGVDAMRQLLFDGQGSWDSPEVITAITTFFVDLRDAGCFNEDANALTYDDGNALFFGGQALLHTTGSWLANDIGTNLPDAEIGFVPFPEIAGGQGRVWVSGVGSAYYLSNQTEHAAEAGQFLDYLSSPETAARWVGEAGFVVPIQFDTASVEVPPLRASIFETLQSATGEGMQFGFNVDVLAPQSFNDVMLNGFQAILTGDKTPEELASELQAAWEAGAEAEGTPAP